jgi:hypothetical protein
LLNESSSANPHARDGCMFTTSCLPQKPSGFGSKFHHRVTYAQSYRQIGQCSSCFESWRPVSICWNKNERACGRIRTLSAKSQPSGLSNNSALCTDRSNVIRTASGKDAGGEEESNCPACVILPGEHGKVHRHSIWLLAR